MYLESAQLKGPEQLTCSHVLLKFLQLYTFRYTVIENLRHMLSRYNPSEPIWMNLHFRWIFNNSDPKLQPGFAISRAAITLIVEEAKKNETGCPIEETNNFTDKFLICLQNMGVKIKDSKDSKCRDKFFIYQKNFLPKVDITEVTSTPNVTAEGTVSENNSLEKTTWPFTPNNTTGTTVYTLETILFTTTQNDSYEGTPTFSSVPFDQPYHFEDHVSFISFPLFQSL